MRSPSCTTQEQLEQWTLRARETLSSPDHVSAAGALANGITSFAADALRACARRRKINDRNALAALPSNVVRAILRELLLDDVLAVSQACHRLRALALAMPEFWNNMAVLSPKSSFRFEQLLMQRAAPVPLQLALAVACLPEPPAWTATCCGLLAEYLARVGRLTLLTELYGLPPLLEHDEWGHPWAGEHSVRLPPFLHPSQWSAICHALGRPAPLLRKFVVYRTVFMPSRPLVLRQDLFRGEAPMLRSCVLSGVALPPACAAFKNLVSLHYHAWNASPALHLDDIGAMLDGLPALTMLCLKDHLLADYRHAPTETAPPPVVERALRTARIFDVRAGSLPFARLRDFFVRCGVRRFECQHSGMLADFPSADTIVAEYPALRALSVRPLYVKLLADDRSGHATTLHIRRAFWDAAFLLAEPRVFAHLGRLTINEHFWLQDEALPPAPALEELCVVLGSCADYRMFSRIFSDGTCGVLHAEHAWAAPALRAVQLAYDPPREGRCAPPRGAAACCCADTLAISLRDVHHFVATCLRFDGPRLESLVLSGVDPVDWSAQDLLSEIADDVQISACVDRAAVAQDDWHSCTDFEHDD